MRAGRAAALVALAATGAVVARAAAWSVVHAAENLDPDAIEREGGLCFIDGAALHLIDRGQGPVLLMIHGFAGATHSFSEQIEALAKTHRVLALDLPGFGYTEPPPHQRADYSHTGQVALLARLLDRLGISRATLIGHSMGGAIALRFAATHPERVERLVLVSAAAPDRRPPLPPNAVIRFFFPFFTAAKHRRMWPWRGARRRMAYDPDSLPPEVWERYRRPWRVPGFAAGLMKLAQDARRDPPVSLPAIGARTLLLWGEADEVVPLRVAHRMHAALPDARLEVVPKAGHLVLEEQPQRATAIIQAFLAETPRADAAHAG